MGDKYNNYDDALKRTGLKTLKQRREDKCLAFNQKCLKHPELRRLLPKNKNAYTLRNKEEFKVNFANYSILFTDNWSILVLSLSHKGWLAIAKLIPLSLFMSVLLMPNEAFDNVKIEK